MPPTGHDGPRDPADLAAPDPASTERVDPYGPCRSTLRRSIHQAREWQVLIDGGQVDGPAGIASREGVPVARVSQLLTLLKLAPEILAQIEDPDCTAPVPTEQQLLMITQLRTAGGQLRRYRAVIKRINVGDTSKAAAARGNVYGRGVQHTFARAREIRAMFDSGEYGTLKHLGEVLGLTGVRVGQILNITQLAPDLIKVLDVPTEKLPKGFTGVHLRRISVLREHDAQRALYAQIVTGLKLRHPRKRR